MKKKTRIDNYLTNTSTGGNTGTADKGNYPTQIQQTGATLPGENNASPVQPAIGSQPR